MEQLTVTPVAASMFHSYSLIHCKCFVLIHMLTGAEILSPQWGIRHKPPPYIVGHMTYVYVWHIPVIHFLMQKDYGAQMTVIPFYSTHV